MVNGDVMFELKELKQTVKALKLEIKDLSSKVNPADELWDNVAIQNYWHLSPRLLAEWRAKGLIGFVQVGHKIWYPREDRELFIAKHMVKMKEGENE